MSRIWTIVTGPLYQRERPERNAEYRRWIKRFPCIGCAATRRIDPSHTGPHGIGQKSSDKRCLPMCRKCHEEFGQNPVRFAERRGLDIEALVQMFNTWWDQKTRKKAA